MKARQPGDMFRKFQKASIKMSGTFQGKSNTLGHGGRAAQLKARGVPGGVIGALARRAQAAPGQKNYHGKKRKSSNPNSPANYGKAMQSAYAATYGTVPQQSVRSASSKGKSPISGLMKEPEKIGGFPKLYQMHMPASTKPATDTQLGAKKAVRKKRKISTAIGNTAAKITKWPGGVNDVRLNRSGSVGTEPISKGNNKYTEVKLGGLGKFDVPMGTLKKRKGSKKKRKASKLDMEMAFKKKSACKCKGACKCKKSVKKKSASASIMA